MTAKEYLRQIRTAEVKIRQLTEEYEELYQTLYGVKGISYDKQPVLSSVSSDNIADIMSEIDAMMCKIRRKRLEYSRKKDEAIELIHMLSDDRYVDILYYVYVKGYKLNKIADILGHEYKWTCRLHGFALEEFDRVLKNTNKHE